MVFDREIHLFSDFSNSFIADTSFFNRPKTISKLLTGNPREEGATHDVVQGNRTLTRSLELRRVLGDSHVGEFGREELSLNRQNRIVNFVFVVNFHVNARLG